MRQISLNWGGGARPQTLEKCFRITAMVLENRASSAGPAAREQETVSRAEPGRKLETGKGNLDGGEEAETAEGDEELLIISSCSRISVLSFGARFDLSSHVRASLIHISFPFHFHLAPFIISMQPFLPRDAHLSLFTYSYPPRPISPVGSQ